MRRAGATWTHLEVKGIPMDSVAKLETVADGTEVMRSVYRGFVDHRAVARRSPTC